MKKQISSLLLVVFVLSCSNQSIKPSTKPSIERVQIKQTQILPSEPKRFELTALEIKKLTDSTLVQSNNIFGTKLFLNLAKNDLTKNLFISPISAAIALQMAYNASDSKNKEEMAKALEINNMSIDDMNSLNQLLMIKLSNPAPDIKLNIANVLWADGNRITINDDFRKTLVNFYDADAINLDFSKSQETTDTINKWAAEKTNNKITKVFEKEYFESSDFTPMAILSNAVYFKADWNLKFKKDNTELKKEFKLPNGDLKEAFFMSEQREFKYYNHLTRHENQKDIDEENKFEVAGVDYGKDGKLSLYMFLPAEDSSLEKFYADLTAENIDKWLSNMVKPSGYISFPKFKIKESYDLVPSLKKQGMNMAFSSTQNEFSKLGKVALNLDDKIYIDKVSQDVFIDVNEEGSEAAAVTSVVVGSTSSWHPITTFIANRPFFYIIRDNETKVNLFMGSVTNPEYN